jgi:hypothetical protein
MTYDDLMTTRSGEPSETGRLTAANIEEEIARRLRGYEAARPVIAAARALLARIDEITEANIIEEFSRSAERLEREALRGALADLDKAS